MQTAEKSPLPEEQSQGVGQQEKKGLLKAEFTPRQSAGSKICLCTIGINSVVRGFTRTSLLEYSNSLVRARARTAIFTLLSMLVLGRVGFSRRAKVARVQLKFDRDQSSGLEFTDIMAGVMEVISHAILGERIMIVVTLVQYKFSVRTVVVYQHDLIAHKSSLAEKLRTGPMASLFAISKNAVSTNLSFSIAQSSSSRRIFIFQVSYKPNCNNAESMAPIIWR